MKKLYFFFILGLFMIISQSTFGQNIFIPDNYFKQSLIYQGFDLNRDNNIQKNEALEIDTLKFQLYDDRRIKSLEGIKEFKNLKKLFLSSLDSLKKLDLSGLKYIETISSVYYPLCELDTILLDSCDNLKSITLWINQPACFSNLGLKYLSCKGCINLEEVEASGQINLLKLSFQNLLKLKTVKLDYCFRLQELKFFNCPKLELLNIEETLIGTNGYYGVNRILDGTPNLKKLFVGGTNDYFENIDFSLIPLLELLVAFNTSMTEIDLSYCPLVNYLYLKTNPELIYLNIKNGSYLEASIWENENSIPKLEKFCVDGNEYLIYKEWLESNMLKTNSLDTVCQTTSIITDFYNDASISIFPNPTQGKLNIQGKNFGNAVLNIQILDALGSIVYSRENVNFLENELLHLDIDLKNGNYWIQLRNKDKISTKPFIFIK